MSEDMKISVIDHEYILKENEQLKKENENLKVELAGDDARMDKMEKASKMKISKLLKENEQLKKENGRRRDDKTMHIKNLENCIEKLKEDCQFWTDHANREHLRETELKKRVEMLEGCLVLKNDEIGQLNLYNEALRVELEGMEEYRKKEAERQKAKEKAKRKVKHDARGRLIKDDEDLIKQLIKE